MSRSLEIFLFLSDSFYDFIRYFFKSDTFIRNNTYHKKEGKILILSHEIEKGLSLRNTRKNYGIKKILELINLLKQVDKKSFAFRVGISSLDSYIKYHKKKRGDVSWLRKKLEFFKEKPYKIAGKKVLSKEEVFNNEGPFYEQLKRNKSIRMFSDEEVKIDKIKKAIDVARHSPSVCNRQSSKTYIIKNRKMRDFILKNQPGNKGFKNVDKLLIVTNNISSFYGGKERNQRFFEGGMFSMNLIHALRSEGIASCPLGWMTHFKKDITVRKKIGIPIREEITLIIALGMPLEKFKVAKSPRKSVEEISDVI